MNAIRFAYNRTAIHRGTPPFFDGKDLGSKVYSYKPGEMVIAVTGGFNISAATATTGIFITNTSQFGDDLTVVHGNHQLGIGGSAAYWKMDFLTHSDVLPFEEIRHSAMPVVAGRSSTPPPSTASTSNRRWPRTT